MIWNIFRSSECAPRACFTAKTCGEAYDLGCGGGIFRVKTSSALEKTENYLAFGAREVWLIISRNKLMQIYYPDGMAKLYRTGERYVPGELMPGFSLDPGDLFA